MALAITIDGTDRVSALQWGSLKITRTSGGRPGRADLVLYGYLAAVNLSLVIADGATTYFNGTIRSNRVREIAPGKFWVTLSALDSGTAPSASVAPFILTDRDTSADAYADLMADPVTPYEWWRLGESSGTTAVGEQSVQDGTYVNTPTLGVTGALADISDTAVTFNGTDEYVTVGSSHLRGQADFTIAAWVKTSTKATSQMIYSESVAAGTPYVRFYMDTNGRPSFQYRNDAGTQDTFAPTSGDWSDGQWHHMAVTKDSTALVIYVDGLSKRTATLTANDTLTGTLNAHLAHDARDNLPLNGSLDEVMIWRTWLSQTQVAALAMSKRFVRYVSLEYGAVNDGSTTTLDGRVTTFEAGLAAGNQMALQSTNSGIAPAGSDHFLQELVLTWDNATTIRYAARFGLTFGGSPPHLAAAFP